MQAPFARVFNCTSYARISFRLYSRYAPLYQQPFASPVFETSKKGSYGAIVVGGGPAGITCVGHLIERNVKPILWVDDKFNGGRVNESYREVPSNTKTKLFLDFASATKPFRNIIEASSAKTPNAITVLEQLPQDEGTSLGNAADMLLNLTEGLTSLPDLPTRKGTLSSASLSTTTKFWTANCTTKNDAGEESQLQVHSPLLILCTGSAPTPPHLPIALPEGLTPLFLDTALQPSILIQHINPEQTTTIAIIGASHSAILCLMNLSNLAMTSHPNLHIKWFTRHPLCYAEYRDGWILRDNTGLKGEAATWARENLEEGTFKSSPVNKFIEKIAYKHQDENTTFKKHLPGCDKYVAAIGYTKNPLPKLERDGEPLSPVFNHETGGFSNGMEGEKIAGLFGAGIAFPERVVDPEGNVEYAVGFWKFVKFVKRVSPSWN